jgi:ATP-dependent RNA helicase RhlE
MADKLKRDGINVAVLHGNRSQSQRNNALKDFQTGKLRVLVATDIASRGIHVDDVVQVINYDLPPMPEDFIHRVGRTGRAGATKIREIDEADRVDNGKSRPACDSPCLTDCKRIAGSRK